VKRMPGGGWRFWRWALCAFVIGALGLMGQGQARAHARPAVAVTHCNASSLQDVVACAEGSVLRMDVLQSSSESQGTGFVIQSDATGTYLLTNKHVAEGGTSDNMTATLPDGKTKYKVLAIAEDSGKTGTPDDLAIVKLPPTNLRPLAWGDSEQLQVGQTVASIGYGLAFELSGPPSVTEGIVSALHRDLGDGFGPAWIQHQSTINHGNSGGPLLNLSGDVVGVNTLSIDQLPNETGNGSEPVQGVFFAIPSNTAQQVAKQLIGQLQNHAVGATVSSFYSSSSANYTYWAKHDTAPPPTPVSVFSQGTKIVAFYFKYQGASANATTFQIIIRDSSGKPYYPSRKHPLDSAAGEHMLSMDNGDPFPVGAYKSDLLINGTVVDSTPFTVGNPAGAIIITHFYSTTGPAYDAWGTKGNYAPPPRAVKLKAGSHLVGLYWVYSGAKPKVSTYQIVVLNGSGAKYFTGQVHTFEGVANAHMSELDNGDAFPNGSYKAEVLVNGKLAATTTFTVG
jgi:S1-C subfamily serine protease